MIEKLLAKTHHNEEMITCIITKNPFNNIFSPTIREFKAITSEIISIHCSLSPDTHHLFDSDSFSIVKKGMMQINTGRGAIINSSDAVKALKSRHLGNLGIDVYEGEENLFSTDLSETIIQDDVIERLMSFNNVLVTPHEGFFTKEAVEQIEMTTIQNFTDFKNGVVLKNEVKLKK